MSSLSLVFARAYQQSFDSRPYSTLAFTNGALNAVGDFVAQTVQIVVRAQTYVCCDWGHDRFFDRRILPMSICIHDTILSGHSGSSVSALEWVRYTWSQMCFGFLDLQRLLGPLIGRWNTFLEHRFPLRLGRVTSQSKVSWGSLSKRVSCDQLLMCVFRLNLAWFFN